MNARDLSYVAVSTALIAVSAWLAVPFGEVPITMQTAVICLIAGLLGAKRAAFAVTAYIFLGAVGVPVFAGFTGGVARLIAPMGGYIVGFLPLAIAVGLVADRTKKMEKRRGAYLAAAMALGTLLCYALGTAWFVVVAAQNGGGVGVWAALILCVFPYLPFDIAKIALAVFLTLKLNRFIKTI
jgi:biotin transport system substrate-specific component